MAGKKVKAKKTAKKAESGTLTIDDVKAIAAALLIVGNAYPLQFVTEKDFYPLVEAYLFGRMPRVKREHSVEDGRIDFKIGGTNPAYLELAVTPRPLVDEAAGERANTKPGTLTGSQNKTELNKLSLIPQSKAKGRFVLLIDLWEQPHTIDSLKNTYSAQQAVLTGKNIINVVYAPRNGKPTVFKVKQVVAAQKAAKKHPVNKKSKSPGPKPTKA